MCCDHFQFVWSLEREYVLTESNFKASLREVDFVSTTASIQLKRKYSNIMRNLTYYI